MQQSVVSPTKEGAGILIRTINPGDGINYPKLGDSCLVHYECSLEDGTIIDDGCGSTTTSEKQKQRPFQFILGEKHIIQGLEVAIQRMSVGQYAEITVPHLYAYGHKGHYPTIPPRSTLIFQLELIKILSK